MSLTHRATAAACGLALLFLSGCAAKLPTYSWTTQDEALAAIRQRHESIRTIQAACDITLTDPNGQSVTLDGALVARNPGWLRMRAWKFNSAVFDLTMTPDGLWVMQGDSPEVAERMPTKVDAERVAEAWGMLSGGFFNQDVFWRGEKIRDPFVRFIARSGEQVRFDLEAACIVRRNSLLPEKYYQRQPSFSGFRFNINLDRYRMINGIAFAHEIDMTGDAGRIVIRLRDVTLNKEPAAGAFKPPARAVKQP